MNTEVNNLIVSPEGRIHRMPYFITAITTNILVVICGGLIGTALDPIASQAYGTDEGGLLGIIITASMLVLLSIYLQICATIKRLRDIKQSPYWSIIAIVPYLCIFITLPCLFIKSKFEL